MSNRLSLEDSSYLLQHQDDPFDWYPWCDEAFEKAKNEHKPIFISIGYSSCHWCHVMSQDVFQNEEIASFMNDHFICIKIDRDERPEIDKYYQQLHILLNRRNGGWPLSVFCTPQNKPFYAGMYLPPFSRDKVVGFSELASIIATKVSQADEKLFQNADEIVQYLKPEPAPSQATVLDLKVTSVFVKQAKHNFDSQNGGFSIAPKFPHVSTLETLICIDRLAPDEAIRSMLFKTLDHMALGGMHDLIKGGFFHYSTESSWLIPHFVKTLYDNALLCSLYAKASRTYHNQSYGQIAKNSADFMIRFMMKNDLFYSYSYAINEEIPGKYFIYTYDEIILALQHSGVADTDLDAAAKSISASIEGNFEGHNIIRLQTNEKPLWFEKFKTALQSLRAHNPSPFLDKKIITSWNAMMIKALFILGKLDSSYNTFAIQSLHALLSMMLDNGKLFHSGIEGKQPKIEAFFDDYAHLCSALLEAYESTSKESYLMRAQQLANKALEMYYDRGRWYFNRGDFTTSAEFDDKTYPSSLSVMVESLLKLGTLIDQKYRQFAFKTLEYHSFKLMQAPIHYPYAIQQIIRYLGKCPID